MKQDSISGKRIVAPNSISDAARIMLESTPHLNIDYPAYDDLDGWRSHIATINSAIADRYFNPSTKWAASGDWHTIAGVPVFSSQPTKRRFGGDSVILDIHGGSLIYLGGEHVRAWCLSTAERLGANIISIDYRMPPDHPFPAALDDCVAVYRELSESLGANKIIVHGSSAGGNLAAALILRAQSEGLDMPAALVLNSPEVDLTESGDTFQTLLGVDVMGSHMPVNRLYAAGEPLDNPLVSPLFGSFEGFPPTFLRSGTRDLFLSNTVRMHRALRRSSVEAELHVWEAMPHGGFLGAPEDEEADDELRLFLQKRFDV